MSELNPYAKYLDGQPLETILASTPSTIAALPAAAGKQVTHPAHGAMTFQTIVETMAGHDLNHRGQLQRLAAGSQSR